jgi:transposase-like protein
MKKKSMGRRPVYEESLKITVAREFLTGNLSLTELAQKYNLPNKGAANTMVVWYRRNYGEEGQKGLVSNAKPNIDTQSGQVNLGNDKAKDRQLEDALLKVEALELLLANAKKELGIDLLKKHGTKRPNK